MRDELEKLGEKYERFRRGEENVLVVRGGPVDHHALNLESGAAYLFVIA